MTTTESSSPAVDDYPHYNGLPIRITGLQWWIVMLGVVVGFSLLVAPIPIFKNTYAQFIPAILFFAIPLLSLKLVAPAHWTAIFRKLRARDFLWTLLFTILPKVCARWKATRDVAFWRAT